MKIKDKKRLIILTPLATISLLIIVITSLFVYGEKTIPSELRQKKFTDATGYLNCETVFTMETEDEHTGASGYFIGESEVKIEDYCGKKVVFSGKFEPFYTKPLCNFNASCANKAAVIKVESISELPK